MRERTDGQGFATRAIHAGERPDPSTHAHKPPIYATSTFAFDTAAEKEDAVDRALAWEPGAYFYSRTGNPDEPRPRGEDRLARRCRGLRRVVVRDGGRRRRRCSRTSGPGDHLIVGDELFAITSVLLDEDFPRRGIEVTRGRHDRPRRRRGRDPARDTGAVHRDVLEPAAAGRRPRRDRRRSPAGTGSCSSPTTRSSGRPCCARSSTAPISSLNAATKYLSGHGDAVSGVVSGRKDLIDPIRKQTDTLGQAASPFASFLVMRGVRTLQLRSRAASANAARDRGASSRATRRSSGSATRAWRRTRTTTSRARLLGEPRGRDAHVPAARRTGRDGRVHGPPRAVRHRRQPGRHPHARLSAAQATAGSSALSVGCEDIEDLLDRFRARPLVRRLSR